MDVAFTLVGLLAVTLTSAFSALTIGFAVAACVLVAREGTRRWVLLAAVAAQLVAVLVTAILPHTAGTLGPVLLGVGAVGVIGASALLFLHRDGHAAGVWVGVPAAALVSLGHHLETAPMYAGIVSGEGATLAIAFAQLAGAAVVLLVAFLLVVLRRSWSPVADGAAVAGLVAAICTLGQLLLTSVGGLSTTLVTVLTLAGFGVGLLVGVVRDRSVPQGPGQPLG